MSKGIFTAVSGAMAQTQKMDTIANNLANVNTPGFKRDQQVFQEYLTAYEKQPSTIEVPRIPASIESFYDIQGGDKSYVDSAGTFTDFSQGSLKQTGNSLDIGLEGEALIQVGTSEGVRMTRVGSFSLDADGRLVTKQGLPVLKEGLGQDANGREIKITGAYPINISASGEIFQNGESLGRLALVQVQNKDALQKVGNNLFTLKNNMDPGLSVAGSDVKVHQGFVENSNVNMVREMTEMIGTTRTFETTQKAIQAYDDMQRKLVTEVPKLGNA